MTGETDLIGEGEGEGEAKRLIDLLARTPRFAGSAEESAARAECAAELRASGFDVREKEFEFSEWPGRWGIPFVTGYLLIGALAVAAVATRDPDTAGAVWMTFSAGAFWTQARRRRTATARLKWLRSRAVNLEARRGTPNIWLVAHTDTKSQSIPMLARVASHAFFFSILLTEIVALFLAELRVIQSPPWGWIAAAAAVTGFPSLLCFVGNKSPGALDNATGVVAVLLAARTLSKDIPLGVLLTSGEELDLAGARAWSHELPRDSVVINCDTVDDAGRWRCMYWTRPHKPLLAAEHAAKCLGLDLRIGRMIPGILADSLAFEACSVPAVTISRGTFGTLARIHTPRDTSDRLTGAGAAVAARLLAGMIEELS